MSQCFDPGPVCAEISAVTGRLLDTLRALSDADVRRPSLLPGWSCGHVMAHIARTADALGNLVRGAAERAERSLYASPDARSMAIEAGSHRPLKEQIVDIEAGRDRFVAAVAAVPPDGWEFIQYWGHWGAGGETRPAWEALHARLREVAIHHVDLDAGYTAADWTPAFALRLLCLALPAFEARGMQPCTLLPTDIDAVVKVAGGSDVEVRGPAHAIATWLLGRDLGRSLEVFGGARPTPPAWA